MKYDERDGDVFQHCGNNITNPDNVKLLRYRGGMHGRRDSKKIRIDNDLGYRQQRAQRYREEDDRGR